MELFQGQLHVSLHAQPPPSQVKAPARDVVSIDVTPSSSASPLPGSARAATPLAARQSRIDRRFGGTPSSLGTPASGGGVAATPSSKRQRVTPQRTPAATPTGTPKAKKTKGKGKGKGSGTGTGTPADVSGSPKPPSKPVTLIGSPEALEDVMKLCLAAKESVSLLFVGAVYRPSSVIGLAIGVRRGAKLKHLKCVSLINDPQHPEWAPLQHRWTWYVCVCLLSGDLVCVMLYSYCL